MSILATAVEAVKTALAHNQFLSGGIVIGAIGALGAWGRSLPGKVWSWGVGQFTVSLEMRSEDESYFWFKQWLAAHPYNARSRHQVLSTYVPTDNAATDTGNAVTKRKLLLTPCPGEHWFLDNGRPYRAVLSRTQPSKDNNFKTFESVTLTTSGRKVEPLVALAKFIQSKAASKAHAGLRIYAPDNWTGWDLVDIRAPRLAESMILADGLLESVLEDIEKFLASREWYESKNIPWRRGFLLYGPPGTGKTTLAAVVGSMLNLDVYYLSVQGKNDDRIQELLKCVPAGSLVVIEEIDTIFRQREADSADSKLTFGGLLNALDGLVSKDGRIVFMTTNHPELLDPALTRPGRVDRKIELGYATSSQIRRQLERFYAGENPVLLAQVTAAVLPGTVTMASLQEHCLEHRDSLKDFKDHLPLLLTPRPSVVTKVKPPSRIRKSA